MAGQALSKVPGAVKTAGQAVGKVPGAVEKVAIQGLEMLDANVPGGIFNPDGSLKGTQILAKYLSPQQIQQAQQHQKQGMAENNNEKIGGRYDPDEFDAMVARVKKLAGQGPMKTVYDPQKRVYRNVPTAVQPKK
jgi:hypothetical protein